MRITKCPKCKKKVGIDPYGTLCDSQGNDNILGWNVWKQHKCKECGNEIRKKLEVNEKCAKTSQ